MGAGVFGRAAVCSSEGNSGPGAPDRSRRPAATAKIYRSQSGRLRKTATPATWRSTPSAQLLYVLDQANFRLVAIDISKKRRIVSSPRLGRLPFAMALSPDKRKAYITNLGMFEYKAAAGRGPSRRARETGLPFPAFGFPFAGSARRREARDRPRTGATCLGLGDPNVRESNSLGVVSSGRSGGAEDAKPSCAPACRSAAIYMEAAALPASWPPPIASSFRTRTTIPSP